MLGVVFVHGIKSSARMWDPFGRLLAQDEELAGLVGEPPVRFEFAIGMVAAWWRLRVVPSPRLVGLGRSPVSTPALSLSS